MLRFLCGENASNLVGFPAGRWLRHVFPGHGTHIGKYIPHPLSLSITLPGRQLIAANSIYKATSLTV